MMIKREETSNKKNNKIELKVFESPKSNEKDLVKSYQYEGISLFSTKLDRSTEIDKNIIIVTNNNKTSLLKLSDCSYILNLFKFKFTPFYVYLVF